MQDDQRVRSLGVLSANPIRCHRQPPAFILQYISDRVAFVWPAACPVLDPDLKMGSEVGSCHPSLSAQI